MSEKPMIRDVVCPSCGQPKGSKITRLDPLVMCANDFHVPATAAPAERPAQHHPYCNAGEHEGQCSHTHSPEMEVTWLERRHHRAVVREGQYTLDGMWWAPDRREVEGAREPAPATPHAPMNNTQIKHMVDRFLQWRLPEDFNPDGGIKFHRTYNEFTDHPMKHEPVGTNLLDATQAGAMVRYMVEGLPPSEIGEAAPSPQDITDGCPHRMDDGHVAYTKSVTVPQVAPVSHWGFSEYITALPKESEAQEGQTPPVAGGGAALSAAQAELAEAREIAYQVCGAAGAPARVLDYFHGRGSNPLPVSPDDFAEVQELRAALAEAQARAEHEIETAHRFAKKYGLENWEQRYPASAICAQLSGELSDARRSLAEAQAETKRLNEQIAKLEARARTASGLAQLAIGALSDQPPVTKEGE